MKENIKAYQETCNLIRHYSTLSYNVRVLVVVQGFVLLGAWILNFEKDTSSLQIIIPCFGLLFTFLLFQFHKGYFSATNFFYDMASKMENELFEEGFKPFQSYNIEHDRKYKNIILKYLILYAPFTLTFVLFIAVLIISLIS